MTDSKLTDNIRRWIEVDNNIRSRRDNIKDLTERRNAIEREITDYVQQHNMQNLQVNVTDGMIKFANRNTYQSVSMKVLKELLTQYFEQNPRDTNVDNICKFVAKNRKMTSSFEMVRSIKGEPDADDQ
jgi:Family of unknown function (DUF5760)